MQVKTGLVHCVEKPAFSTNGEIAGVCSFETPTRIICHCPRRRDGMRRSIEIYRADDPCIGNGPNPDNSIFTTACIEA